MKLVRNTICVLALLATPATAANFLDYGSGQNFCNYGAGLNFFDYGSGQNFFDYGDAPPAPIGVPVPVNSSTGIGNSLGL